MTSEHSRPSTDHIAQQLEDVLVLEKAGPESWRVCDGRRDPGEGRFLAFIERQDDAYEVMQLADDFIWTTFATMKDALAHVIASHDSFRMARRAGALSWLE